MSELKGYESLKLPSPTATTNTTDEKKGV
jgi:hypothetical protein